LDEADAEQAACSGERVGPEEGLEGGAPGGVAGVGGRPCVVGGDCGQEGEGREEAGFWGGKGGEEDYGGGAEVEG